MEIKIEIHTQNRAPKLRHEIINKTLLSLPASCQNLVRARVPAEMFNLWQNWA